MFKKSLGFLGVVAVLALTGCGSQTASTSPNTPESINVDQAVVKFQESHLTSHPEPGQPVCAAKTLWTKESAPSELIAYVASECMDVVVKNNDLYSTSGYGASAIVYKLAKKSTGWEVIDYDERESKMETTKQWVKDYEKLLPAKTDFDVIALGASLTAKAGKVFNIPTAEYGFKSCQADTDCPTGEMCDEASPTNLGSNKCLKTCATQEECGKGYSCRRQCLHGENGCPTTAVAVCMPDLPSQQLDKTGKPW